MICFAALGVRESVVGGGGGLCSTGWVSIKVRHDDGTLYYRCGLRNGRNEVNNTFRHDDDIIIIIIIGI